MSDNNLTTDELNAIFAKACDDQQNGKLEQAKSGYERLLDLFSQAPILHYNLGLIYFEQKDFISAVQAFEKGVALSPEDVDLLFNLALARKKQGDLYGAVADFTKVLESNSDCVDTLYNLGGCYRELKEVQKALDCYRAVLRVDAEHSACNSNIAYLYQLTGDTEKAVHHYQKVLDVRPDHEAAGHMLAALTGEQVSGTPSKYVVEVFDNYSERYEESLVEELEYQVPTKLRRILSEKKLGAEKYKRGLDLGCGTGLSGEAFYDIVDLLDGVDLSPKMVAIAEGKSIYDELVATTIVEFLEATNKKYDLFLAADVFTYVGALEQMFDLIRKQAIDPAILCFSTELIAGEGYRLRQSGRFGHSREYIESLVQSIGWVLLSCTETQLRKEKADWVIGDLWVVQLSS